MPQFDSSTFSSQIFWLFISGLSLIFFVRLVLMPRVESIFKNRKDFSDKEQESIRVLEKQLDDIKAERQKEVRIAEEKAYKFLLSVKKDLEIEKNKYVSSLEDKMSSKVASFENALSKRTAVAKDEYAKNVESYLNIVKQGVTSSGMNDVK